MKKTTWTDIFSEQVCKKLLYVLLPILVLGSGYIGVWGDNRDDQTDLSFRARPFCLRNNLLEDFRKISPAVVLIQTFDENKKLKGYGSGFFISERGYLITNHHVIREVYSGTVKTIDGQTYSIKGIIAKDISADIAKLVVDVRGGNVPVLELANTLPGWGDDTVVLGHPGGCELTLSKGIVRAGHVEGRISRKCRRFEISAPASPGSSGSPVLNMEGQVIGVAQSAKPTSYKKSGCGATYAVAASNISNLKTEDSLISLKEYAESTPKVSGYAKPYLQMYPSRFSTTARLKLEK